MKIAIAILADPKNGSEEALGRVVNGIAVAYDFKQADDACFMVQDRLFYHQDRNTQCDG